MNLTALPMGDVVPDQTIQKLIIEPLCAASLVTGFSGDWLDLGSGGGSPALPLRAALSSTHSLSLVESRGRKCAFLREAARQLEFGGVSVLDCRFDEMPATEADLVTFRAVRVDEGFLRVVLRHLRPGGVVLAFGSSVHHSELTQVDSSALPDGSTVLKLVRRT
jgi:16S rRNA (guanine527-N7)-methyltransferase